MHSLVTILAFIYVPLNLATSIFGMNLQQLNKNGQNVSAFLATVIVALAVTGGTWLIIDQMNAARRWLQPKNVNYGSERHFSTMERIVLLFVLVRRGHALWLVKSRAWSEIWKNGHGYRQFHDGPEPPPHYLYALGARNYALKCIRDGKDREPWFESIWWISSGL